VIDTTGKKPATSDQDETISVTNHCVSHSTSRLLPVAILAGGLATRMRPHTDRIPKSLLEIEGEPFIAHQLRLLADQGVTDVVLCTGHLGQMIEDVVGDGRQFSLTVRYSRDGQKLRGTAGAVKCAIPLLGEMFFVMYGDSYLPGNFLAIQQKFLSSNRLGLMTVYRNEGRFDHSNVEYINGEIHVYDKQIQSAAFRHIDFGLELFQSRALDSLSDDKPRDLATLMQELLDRRELASYEVQERFYEIGSLQGWRDTAAYLKTRTTRERMSA
jgi:NDP-sugar pyrophosphorylase family protein